MLQPFVDEHEMDLGERLGMVEACNQTVEVAEHIALEGLDAGSEVVLVDVGLAHLVIADQQAAVGTVDVRGSKERVRQAEEHTGACHYFHKAAWVVIDMEGRGPW